MLVDPGDLLDFAVRTEDGYGRLRVPGVGHVETEFIAVRFMPLVPVQTSVVAATTAGEMSRPLPKAVLRSVVLAYVRRWVGLTIPFVLLLNVVALTSRWAYPPYFAVLAVVPIVVLALSWWPLGTVPLSVARRIARDVDIPQHRVDLAYGIIDASVAAEAEAAWHEAREVSAAAQRSDYEANLAAFRKRRRGPRRGRGRPD